jgi:glycine/D-amino acid oxidase-like deaminating enzyme
MAALGQVEEFAPTLAGCGRITATTCGYYETTPDANPLIGYDAHLTNLIHAAGFSGHGVMHAPITAVLVAALATNGAPDGLVHLPEPCAARTIDLKTFDPGRDFSISAKESRVL